MKKPRIVKVTRQTWNRNPVTKVKANQKGKGSYNRRKNKDI